VTDADGSARAYLLGELSPEQEEAFEQRFASDDGLFAAVEAEEEELIDDYVGGRLAPALRERFEARLLASPAQRQRVAFARALAGGAAAPARRPTGSRRPAFLSWAAVLALAAAGSLLAVREVRTLNGALALSRAGEEAAQRQADALQRRIEALEQSTSPPAADAVRWTLRPGWERGTGPERALATGSAAWVRVDLVLEERPQAQDRFQVRVETPEGHAVTTQDGLSAGTVDGRPVVAVLLPARLLQRGTYLVGLTVTRAGVRRDLASYKLLAHGRAP
jgi:hypothetical protein